MVPFGGSVRSASRVLREAGARRARPQTVGNISRSGSEYSPRDIASPLHYATPLQDATCHKSCHSRRLRHPRETAIADCNRSIPRCGFAIPPVGGAMVQPTTSCARLESWDSGVSGTRCAL